MARLDISDEDLEKEVDKLMPWSSKRYKNGRRDVHSSMLEDSEIYDWMTRRYTKKIVVLLQRGYSRREVAYRLGCHRLTVEMVDCMVEAGKYLKLPLELAGEAKISFEGSWRDVH